MAGFGFLERFYFQYPTANPFLNFCEIIFRFTGNRKELVFMKLKFDEWK
jgi:hypothetical protein